MKIFTQKTSMRFVLSYLLTLFLVFHASSQNSIQNAIDRFKLDPDLEHASISFLVTEAGNGKRIASLNASTSLAPASTTKLFATAGAIELLGKNYRPQTRLYIDGVIENGQLKGNLRIRGGGDVSLGSKFFNEEGKQDDFLAKWADTLHRMGIQKITGKIIADGSEFGYAGIPDGWGWSDMGNYYGAGPSGICLYDNMIRFYFKTGANAGDPTELIDQYPKVAGLNFRNGITSEKVSGDNSYIYGAPFSNDRFSTGSLPLNNSRFEVKGSLPDPEAQLAVELLKALQSKGIVVQEGAQGFRESGLKSRMDYENDAQLVFTHYGATVDEIATITNMKSINLFAEGLICLIGYKLTGKGTTEEGVKQLENYLSNKMSLHGLFLKDGSGLSRSNGISASHFCALLNFMYTSANYQTYFATLPEAGKTGTLSSLCKGQAGQSRIFAKSGTMSRTKSYAGYVYSSSGKKMTFSITAANFNCSSFALTKKMELVLNAMAIF